MIKQLLFTSLLLTFLNVGAVFSGEITIRFIGNCGLHLSDGVNNIYTDFPYVSGFHQYMEYDDEELNNIEDSSIFIFTHKHPDHYSKRRMRKVIKTKGGTKYGSWNIKELEKLGDIIPDFSIKAFKNDHFLSAKHYSYLIEWHGKRIFLSGDTESGETILSVQNMDWAFLPAWLIREVYVNQGEKIDSKKIGIYHIGTKDKINIEGGDKIKMFKKQGEIISISY